MKKGLLVLVLVLAGAAFFLANAYLRVSSPQPTQEAYSAHQAAFFLANAYLRVSSPQPTQEAYSAHQKEPEILSVPAAEFPIPLTDNEAEKLEKKAEAGDRAAQAKLCHDVGWIPEMTSDKVLKDTEKAWKRNCKWCLVRAKQGDKGSQGSTGLCYMFDLGLPQDDVEAYFWYSLAGTPIVQAALETLRERLTPEQIKEVEERVANWKPEASSNKGEEK